MARHGKTESYKGSRQDNEQTAATAKQHRPKPLA